MPDHKDPDQIEISYVPDEDEKAAESESLPKSRRGSGKGTAGLKQTIAELEEKIEKQKSIMDQVRTERDEFQDKYLRNLAEMDNFRKRVSKEKEDYQRFVLGEFLMGLLEIYDNFERALRAHTVDDSPKAIISGIQMIFKQLRELLRKYQVEELDPHDRAFDPNYHQALSREEREGINDPMVVEVYQKGFLYNDKLLRPALVRVAVPSREEDDEPNGGQA